MGETESESAGDAQPSEEPEEAPAADTLQVPTQIRMKLKSPTPGTVRGRSATPIHGRSQTPFNLYLTRRSATPSNFRSITPFIQREDKEKTPFELGRVIKDQTICNTAVFDRALVMDISEPVEIQRPVRYITSDLSIIDRAAVMDISNVEVIYVVEEYEEEEEEIVEELVPKKKEKKARKARTPRKSVDMERSPSIDGDLDLIDREDSADLEEVEEPVKKGKKKPPPKKKEKKEKSPSPKLTLKLEIGGGQKATKKQFEEQQKQAAAAPARPPPKKSKLALQMEEQIKQQQLAAAQAAEKEAAKKAAKLAEQERLEAERRAQEEAEAAEAEEEEYDYNEDEEYGEGGDGGEDGEGGDEKGDEDLIEEEEEEEEDEADKKRRGSDSSDDFTKPDPEEEARWQRLTGQEEDINNEGVDADVEVQPRPRKYSWITKRSEKERDDDWQKIREMTRLPHFMNYLTDRAVPVGQTIRLACAVDGPELTVKWFKDDVQLQRDATHRISNNNNIMALEILKTTVEDTGVYKCVLSNVNDVVTSSCTVTIYEATKDPAKPPSFKLIKEYYNLRDDELTIEANVKGVPRPKISWWRGAFEIKPSYKYTLREEPNGVCKLIIYKPSGKDSGIYLCRASNSCGETQIPHEIEVGGNLKHSVAGIFRASDRLQKDKGKQARKIIEEALRSKDESERKSREAAEEKLILRRSGSRASLISQSSRIMNDDEPYERRSRAADPTPRQMLHFSVFLSNRYVPAGSKVKLQAVVDGFNPSFRWQKDGVYLAYGSHYHNKNVDNLAGLELVNVQPEDSGTYTVVAQNEFCTIASSGLLQVYETKVNVDAQPVFIRSLKEMYHLNSNQLVLETAVRGQPTPKIQWYRDCIDINSGGRYKTIELQDGTCQLIIDNPVKRDSGKYVAKADNRAGEMKISHYVMFEGKDSHIAENTRGGGIFHADKNLRHPKVEAIKATQYPADTIKTETDATKDINYVRRRGGEEKDDGADGSNKRREKNIGIRFATTVRDLVVTEGSKVKISCFLEAKEPLVKWFKNDQQIQNSTSIRGRHMDGLCLLEIMNASLNDSGEYKCVANDETGEVSTTCKLEVYANAGTDNVPPTFTRNIKDTFHGKTNELQLDVQVRGLPTPSITWVKDGLPIQPSAKYQQVQHDDGTCELFISKPLSKDSGKYVCQAENSEGRSEIAHVVTVRPPSPSKEAGLPNKKEHKPKEEVEAEEEEKNARREVQQPPDLRKQVYFRTFLSNRTVLAGSTVKWMVNIDGPEPTTQWFHDNQVIVNGTRTKMYMSDGIAWLRLEKVTEEDAGEYKLKVRGTENELVSSCTLFVYRTDKEDMIAPVFTMGIKDTYSLNENELVLDCRVRGKPRPDIQWMKNLEMIYKNDKYKQIDEADGYCKLIISKPTENDSGLYICIASNSADECRVKHHVEFVGHERFTLEKAHGFFHRDPKKPHFLGSLRNQTVCNGGTIAISAEFNQTITPIEVQWLRNNQRLYTKGNIESIVDHGVYTLVITNATAAAEGTYTCRAITEYGRAESHATVDVVVGADRLVRPPLFLSRPDPDMKIQAGDPFSISFRIDGDPRPKFTFLKGTTDITKSNRVSTEASEDFTRFTMRRSEPTDSATYFIVARNNFGTDRIFVNVAVKVPKRK